MRTALALPLIATLASSSAFAWNKAVEGNGDIATETRALSAITGVDASGGMNVDIQTGEFSIKLEGDKNLLALVKTEVKGSTLEISPRDNTNLRPTKTLRVTVTVPSLNTVSASGAVAMNVDVPLTKAAKIDGSGGVRVRARKIDADSLTLDASGGVEMSLAGKATDLKVDLSGGVDIRAKQVAAKTLTIDASGGCQLEASVSESVKGEISGGVDIDVYGSPKVEVSRSGGASVDVHR